MFSPSLRKSLQSLRFRLTVWNSVVTLLAALAALFGLREGLRFTLEQETDALLRDETLELSLAFEQSYPDQERIHQELDRKAAGHVERGWFLELLDKDGLRIWESGNAPELVFDKTPAGGKAFSIVVADHYRIAERRIAKPGRPGYTVRIGTRTEFIDNDVNKLTRLMLPIGAALLVLAPLGGYLLARRATRPLRKIIDTTERLRPSRMDERLPLRGSGDELDQLSEKINQFLDQIAQYLARNREFVANAAHELRSPLTAIQNSVDVTLGRSRTVLEYEEQLISINDECRQLTVLVNQLLTLAESDAVDVPAEAVPVRLDEVIQTSLNMFEAVAEEQAVRLESNIDSPTTVLGDRSRWRQVVVNLIDNALKFTPAGGEVRVTLHRHVGTATLTVSDAGIGIASDELPRVFDRFYQVDRSRQRLDQRRGNGLGLSICQSIVTAYGGTINATSQLGKGTRFRVEVRRLDDALADGGN